MPTDSGHIRFATDILRRLGEELNPSIDQGILELVKNSYDADATSCEVQIDLSGTGMIRVVDDGDGMSGQEILDNWLVLGSSGKQTSKRTAKGRIPAGNKGLGRLAALRLGHLAELKTYPRGSRNGYSVRLNWDEFDQVSIVDEVNVPLRSLTNSRGMNGTEIVVTNLRRRVGRMEVKRLARSMILLADPFGDTESGFSPTLLAPEYADLEKLVSDRYFSECEYHLVGTLARGRATATVEDWRGNVLYAATPAELDRDSTGVLYDAPDLTFDLWVFDLRGSNFSTRSTSLSEVKDWLDSFGGVHVYANGIRVNPYGNAGVDWLDMNLRRARSPEERPSTNNSIGRVAIQDPTEVLGQKTDRSGFIESEQYEELKRFAVNCLEWMARRRLAVAEVIREKNRIEAAAKVDPSASVVKEQIAKVPAALRPDLNDAFQKYTAVRDRETDALRKEVQLYRTLSTAGITAATFAHESNGGPIKVIVQAANAIRRRGRSLLGEAYQEKMEAPVEGILRAARSLSVLAQATLRLVDQDKRRVGRVDLHAVVKEVLETFQPFFVGRDVMVETDFAGANAYIRGTEAAVESVLTNLLNNSLSAFAGSDAFPRTIKLTTKLNLADWVLTVSDNGPGIVGISLRDIWLPGQTRRDGGTGLGLTIVRDSVSDLGGRVSAIAHGELGGATFSVSLPLLEVSN